MAERKSKYQKKQADPPRKPYAVDFGPGEPSRCDTRRQAELGARRAVSVRLANAALVKPVGERGELRAAVAAAWVDKRTLDMERRRANRMRRWMERQQRADRRAA